MGELLFRDWLFISAVLSGIIFLIMGIYYLKTDTNSWVRSSVGGIEFPEWSTFIYAGAFFIVMAIIIKYLA
jgi:uncharacterized membrane protein